MVGNGVGPAVVVWLFLAATAFGLGALREVVVRPRIGELRAHQWGTLAGCAAFGTICWIAVRRIGYTPGEALLAGALWALGGIAFDYVMSCVIGKQPDRFRRDYRLREGRLTALLWLTLVVVPFVAALN
ncbi:MAG: hypothetical protein ACYTHK_03785 [Planctomycetota bacterium]